MSLSSRMWRVGGIAAAVLLLVGAWFALISPTMNIISNIRVREIPAHLRVSPVQVTLSERPIPSSAPY